MSTHATGVGPANGVTVELVAATDLDDEERRRLRRHWWRNPAAFVVRFPVILVAALLALSLGIIPAALVLAAGLGVRALVRFAGDGWGRCREQRQRGGLWTGWGREADPLPDHGPDENGRVRLIALRDEGVVLGEGRRSGHHVTLVWPDIERLRLVYSTGTTSGGMHVIERSGRETTIVVPVDDEIVAALRSLGAMPRRVRPTAPDPLDVARHVIVDVMSDPETTPHFGTRGMGWLDFTVAMSVMIGPVIAGGVLGGLVFGSWRAVAIGVTLGLAVGGAPVGLGFQPRRAPQVRAWDVGGGGGRVRVPTPGRQRRGGREVGTRPLGWASTYVRSSTARSNWPFLGRTSLG